jgi:hypothetical protein
VSVDELISAHVPVLRRAASEIQTALARHPYISHSLSSDD